MYQTIVTDLNEGILIVTISRPDKLNALNKLVFEELNLVLDDVASKHEIRSVIIIGNGTKAFVAGADIAEFIGLSSIEGKTLAQIGQDIFFRIENSSKPIIACVNGYALGGGCELAMSCHLRIASEHAKFGQPEINLALIPGYGGTQRLTNLIGKGRAMEMILTGNMINATTALQFGLVNKVVPQIDLLDTAISILQNIMSKSSISIAAIIQSVNAAGTKDGYKMERESFGNCFGTEDMKEGVNAFLEKRKAVFNDK